jgi:hypothetical protein
MMGVDWRPSPFRQMIFSARRSGPYSACEGRWVLSPRSRRIRHVKVEGSQPAERAVAITTSRAANAAIAECV